MRMRTKRTICALLFCAVSIGMAMTAHAGEQGPFGAFKSRIRPDASEKATLQGFLMIEQRKRSGGFGPAEVNVQNNHWGASNTWNDNRGSSMSASTVIGNNDVLSVSGSGDGFTIDVTDGTTTQSNERVRQGSGVTISVGDGGASGSMTQNSGNQGR